MNPKRGEIWLVDLNPTRGAEIRKTRPIVVINSDLNPEHGHCCNCSSDRI
ncbi:type II toxin-antitoxin system PemK/MazF family toxin [Candidatus Poribacteria bacterium]|nr:type II toxin-antitoxin system PemK/MazF family toxin [Candidatus Poribacteria bacterium]